jgi:Concanavalin A-like lectin/glucanases superfamily
MERGDRVLMTTDGMKEALLAYYLLKGDGRDSTGHERHADVSPSVTWVPGVFGSAANFQRSGARVSASFDDAPEPGSYTISAWVNLAAREPVSGESGVHGVIAGALTVNYATGRLCLRFLDDPPSQVIDFESSMQLPVGEWMHVLAEYDEEERAVRLYCNGNLDSTHPVVYAPNVLGWYPMIGAAPAGADLPETFNGSISDVALFDDSLAPCCIACACGYINVTVDLTESGQAQSADTPDASEAFLPPLLWVAVPVLVLIAGVTLAVLKTTMESQSAPRPLSPEALAERIASIVGKPARAGARATRAQVGLTATSEVHVDIGGCGYYTNLTGKTRCGFPDAININDKTTNPDSDPPNENVPALVLVNRWATNPIYPLEDEFADYVTMQSAPLYDVYVPQIAKLLRRNGAVGLWIDEERWASQIAVLAELLNCEPIRCTAANHNLDMDEFKGAYVFPKLLLQAHR